MMEGFTRTTIKTSGADIVTVHGGKGPPCTVTMSAPLVLIEVRVKPSIIFHSP